MRLGIAIPAALAALSGALLAGGGGLREHATPLLSALALVMLWRLPNNKLLIWMLMSSVVFFSLQQEWKRRLPVGLSGEDVSVEAIVTDAQEEEGATRLRLTIETCHGPDYLPSCDSLGSVRVSAYSDVLYRTGERWMLTLRLRPPSGFVNPNTFDYEQWLWREGIHATGYVRSDPPPQRLAVAAPTLRDVALDLLSRQPLEPQTKRWLAALTLGDSRQLTQEDWALLNATGTTHLVVISGLHVGLVASFTLMLARLAARIISPRNWRLRPWPWWMAATAAVGYATLAGLAPPAMRAMVMTLLGLWVLSGRHAPGPWQAWWLALALILVTDPLSLWRPGLWLSFIAVGWLIIIWQGRARPKGWRGWCWAVIRSQLLLAPLMAAAVLLAFGRLAPAAPIVNLVAVPWVSSVMVPSALLGWLLSPLPSIGVAIWWCFEQALHVFHYLLVVTEQHVPLWEPSPGFIFPLAGGLLLLALCWGLPGVPSWLRTAATLLVVSLVVWLDEAVLPEGVLEVTVYDVGQGQLIELRSTNHRMLYDTGPRFRRGFMPLQTLWPPGQRFDQVMVSHADIDHAGGVSGLLRDHHVGEWFAPNGEALAVSSTACKRGQQWDRDGVHYRVLWPPPGENSLSSNDRSCVLEVSLGEHRLLITGDVGRNIERRFIAEVATPVSVLVAGHHGSRTSSGVQFVQISQPEHVIFSAGRGNPFNHPVDEVVRRFRRQHSCLWSTAHDGALMFTLQAEQDVHVIPLRKFQGVRNRC